MEKKSIICFESETYTAHATSNVDFDTDILRYAYQSMATPASIIDFNMKTREKVTKEQEVLGGFDKDNYIEERVWATAKDGTQVPISMVYKKGSDDGKTHYCFMPMVHMVIPWMPIFHQQDYPYSTEVLCHCAHSRW
jgi:oligopeptidase B